MAYMFCDNVLGANDVTVVTTTAPGIAVLPSTALEPQLGEIRKAYDTTLGAAEFIYLKIPTSSTYAAGNLVQWTAGYASALLPVLSTSANTSVSIAVCPVAVASSTSVQYGWFQIQGQVAILKTAVAVSSTTSVPVYASATAGRVKVLTSAGGQILGIRTWQAASVASTVSTVNCFIDRPKMQGQIT